MPATKVPGTDPFARARALLAEMNLTEKVAQLRSVWLSFDAASGTFGLDPAFPQGESLKAAIKDGIGHFTRPYGNSPVGFGDGVKALNAAIKAA